jgi:uncharacterized protein (DUF3084 family)
VKDQAETAWAEYDGHLTKAEDRLEAAARRAETSFEEHTAVPEAHLQKSEDDLEAAAHRVDTKAAERDAQVRERISQAREHVTHEYELAANLAETDKALGMAVKKGNKQAKAARGQLKRKAAARSRKHDSDGLRRYSLEATAGRSDVTALPELVRGQSLLHR